MECETSTVDAGPPPFVVRRLPDNPIIRPDMDGRMGSNINGPSLIRVPDWLPNPLGRYYLYFAHHQGRYIRMAYADRLEGPYRTYEPGVLPLEETGFLRHIASPDVHVDHEQRRIRMYFHGVGTPEDRARWRHLLDGHPFPGQETRAALSDDGLSFRVLPELTGTFYFRAFQWRGRHYAVTMPMFFSRSDDGLTGWERGPSFFGSAHRHSAVLLRGDRLHVFLSRFGDCPEHIMVSTIDLCDDWRQWRPTPPVSLLKPEMDWEGADCPPEPSKIGAVHQRVRQLRDPAIHEEEGRTYLLYSVAGEAGIAIAQLLPRPDTGAKP